MREFKAQGASDYGIHIDSEKVSLTNAERICLVGNTDAELIYNDPEKRHVVILMHGAKAHITATGFAVVFVYAENGCEINKTVHDFAKIL